MTVRATLIAASEITRARPRRSGRKRATRRRSDDWKWTAFSVGAPRLAIGPRRGTSAAAAGRRAADAGRGVSGLVAVVAHAASLAACDSTISA